LYRITFFSFHDPPGFSGGFFSVRQTCRPPPHGGGAAKNKLKKPNMAQKTARTASQPHEGHYKLSGWPRKAPKQS
jgi:hypothetical protein